MQTRNTNKHVEKYEPERVCVCVCVCVCSHTDVNRGLVFRVCMRSKLVQKRRKRILKRVKTKHLRKTDFQSTCTNATIL